MGIQAAESHDVLAAIVSARQVTLSQVLTLRRQVWPDGEVSRPEAERLIEVHRSLTEICAEWSDFLVETLSDHLIDQAIPPVLSLILMRAGLRRISLQRGAFRGRWSLNC